MKSKKETNTGEDEARPPREDIALYLKMTSKRHEHRRRLGSEDKISPVILMGFNEKRTQDKRRQGSQESILHHI